MLHTPFSKYLYYRNEVLFCASTCSISGGHSEVSQQHLCISSINTHAHSSIHLRIIIRSIIPSSSHARLPVHQVTVRLMTQAALYQNRLRMRVANIVARVCRVAHAHNFRCQPARDESASLNVTPALHCISAQSHIPKAHKSTEGVNTIRRFQADVTAGVQMAYLELLHERQQA